VAEFQASFLGSQKLGFLVVMCLADWFFHSQHLWPWILLLRELHLIQQNAAS